MSILIIYIIQMYIRKTSIYRNWDKFYKDKSIFKWKLRPTMAEAWREYCNQWWYKYRQCPKTIRRTFKEDYQAFKDRRWQNEVYVVINWSYEHEVNVWQFQVVVPIYEVENWVIKRIFREVRGWYPLALLNATQIEQLPRDGWEITPGEKFIDSINKYWRDADMFVALSWHNAEKYLQDNPECNNLRTERANITWAWKPIINEYNFGYSYENCTLVPGTRPT